MPIGFNSPARNFFLLGSSGIQTATNFFKAIDQSSTTDGFFSSTGIKYSSYDEKYILSGSAENSQANSFGYLEKREEDGTLDWNNRIQSVVPSGKLNLTSLELDTNGDLIVGGLSNSAPWIAKYSNTGGLVWQSTTNTGDVRYFGIGIDSSNNYYAAGRTERNDLSNPNDTNRSNAVVEKYDSNGNPLWGKSVSIGAENASFQKVDANDTSVICAGYIEDNVTKGYFAKYDSVSGVLQWDRTLESKETDGLGVREKTSIEDIHVDSDGFIYLCGVLSFGEVESNTFNQSRGFITKYTPEGNQLWCREVGALNSTAFIQYYNIKVDDNTKQVIVFGISSNTNSTRSGLLTKLSSSGEILWHRQLLTDRVPPTLNEFQRRVGFDADASFYYIFFTDDDFNKASGTPDEYTFGKVSSSGNGIGSFVYNPEVGIDINYTIANIPDRIGKLQDGSVRNDSSDFISYPFNGTKIMFDDLATPVTNKKAIISDKDIILRSGSPAIRRVDFQELNLLGDVYSGSGDWLDQSGKGNDGNTSSGEPFYDAGGVRFDGSNDYLEISNSTDFQFGTGDWTIEFWWNGAPSGSYTAVITTLIVSNEAGTWRVGTRYQSTNKLYFARGTGSGFTDRQIDVNVNDGLWHHIAFVRSNGVIIPFVDGVDRTSDLVNGDLLDSNSMTTSNPVKIGYNQRDNAYIEGSVSQLRVVKGTAVYTSNFTPPTETLTAISNTSLLTCQGNSIADASSSTHSITINGAVSDLDSERPAHNAAGYWEFDGVDDFMTVPTFTSDGNIDFSIETWFKADSLPAGSTSRGYIFDQTPNTEGVALRVGLNGTITTFAYAPSSSAILASGVTASIDTWYHTVSVFENGKVSLYVDGQLVDDTTGTMTSVRGPIDESLYPFTLGASTHINGSGLSTEFFDGQIGEFRIYPRVLTPAQVYQNYNATKSKYINEAPDTAPRITSDNIVIDSNLLLNYDFGNRATYDYVENLYKWSNNFSKVGDIEDFWNNTAGEYIPGGGPYGIDAWEFALTQYSGNLAGEASLQQRILPNYPAGTVTTQRWLMRSAPGYGTQTVYHKHGRNAVYGANQANVEFDITEEWSEITTTDSVYTGNNKQFFGIGTVNAGVVVQVASAQLWIGDENAKYFDTYGVRITAPTTVKNLSSSSLTGTINGATFDTDGYFEFPSDGTTLSEITIPNFTGFTGGNNPYSYGFWIRSSGSSADEDEVPFFYGNQSQGQAIRIRYYESGNIVLGHWGGPGYDLDAGTVVSNVLEWNHIYETYDGTTNRLYVNGVDVFDATPNTLNIPASATLILGHRPSSGAGFTNSDFGGDIGELQVYNTTLTATEVLQNFNATKSKYGL